ncbi:MAG: phosphopantothenoylcysteine decarboxylase [Propionibacteriaceae bacterium]|jgi:phosphopantothenoylcysteine decarboxylase/phosphopantothenoylcysteine decarboxylase/phosphopantothenate--cysteine ligase|nr:phosphopantothenoylcysteine decarboxylase [Propionibacteriaceae bacterium]
MSSIILGVTGSIAAYKAADLAHRLTADGHQVDVILTRAGAQFVTPLTFQTLTGRPVGADLFADAGDDVRHITLARTADLALVAPATADIIGKLAAGIADDYLTTVLLALRGQPQLLAPAMNWAMYAHPAVQDNLATLRRRGWEVVEPVEGRLACGETGRGALAPVADILDRVGARLGRPDERRGGGHG